MLPRAVLLATVLLSVLATLAAPQPLPSTRPLEEYQSALAACARGELEAAAAMVADLEARAEPSDRSAAELRRSELRLVKRLGRRSPEALLPIALLHHRVARAHAQAGLPALATAASEQAEALGESYARAGGDRVLAAALLTGLAGYQHARFQETVATSLYRRALELDPRQPAALLGLAVVFEKRGWLREAGSLLDVVTAQAPQDRESRLRQALVHARSGRLEQAFAALDGLVPEGGDDWIAALAYQERARLLASTGQLAEALATAREGQAMLPCDPALPLLAALYAEQAGVAAEGLAEVLAECAAKARPSPRRMYNQHPRRLLEQTWLRLEQGERERLPALAAALGARASG